MTELFKGEITNISDFDKKVGDVLKGIPLYYDNNKIWYRWNKELFKWEIVDETDILLQVREETSIANISQNFISQQIINALRLESRKRKPKPLRSTQIQFKDKIIDVLTGDVMRANEEYFSFNPIPYEIGISESTPVMDRFIREWVGKENVKKIYQWIAYQLLPDMPIHRIMFLYGSGSNGKSTLIELIRRFLGEGNYCAGDFDSVFVHRFGTSILYKKLAILMPEADFNRIEKTAKFKSATGNDPLLFEMKNKSAFTEKSYAKVTISTNTLPMTLDKTDSFYRRIMDCDFPNRFKEKFDILSMIPKWEFPNLAKKCIRLLQELLATGCFDNEGTLDEKRVKYEERSNPISVFIREQIEETPDNYISKGEFAVRVNEWLRERGHRNLTNKEISQLMKESYQDGWGTITDESGNSKSARVWHGVYWKEQMMERPVTEEVR